MLYTYSVPKDILEKSNEIISFEAISENVTSKSAFWLFLKNLNVDIDYARWLSWLFTPIMITFLLPIVILFLLYLSALWLYLYKYRQGIVDAFRHDFWDGAIKTLSALWDAQGWIWHGYEIEGLENIPDNDPALIVYYHGALPIDFYYLLAKCNLQKGRLIRIVGDKFLFKIPGFALLLEAFKVIPGTVSTCSSILQEGNLLAISPGGVYEAQFSTEYYEVMWKNRMGFAKVAIEAQVPIIPMFTQNLREGFRAVQWGRSFFYWLYTKTRLPLVPIYGCFPVKLKTFIGKPIQYDPNISVEDLTAKTLNAIQNLIREHQVVPGSIIRALLHRFYSSSPSKVV